MNRTLLAPAMALAIVAAFAAEALAAPLAGTVLDGTTLKPVAKAEVTAASTGATVTTDRAGRFAFEDLAPGPQDLAVVREGYEPSTESIELVEAGSDAIVLLLYRPGAGEVI